MRKKTDSLLVHGTVSEFMSSPAFTLRKEATIAEAKEIMRKERISGIPIVDENGRLLGLISIENIIMALEERYIEDPIEKHMVKDVIYVYHTMDVSNVMGILTFYNYGRYPVVDNDLKVVGVITKGDLMDYLYGRLGNIYMHNKRRDDLLKPMAFPTDQKAFVRGDDRHFEYRIDTVDIDMAGIGSTLFKKYLQGIEFPSEDVRRASIALYEAEVNVVIHAGGKGCIEAYFDNDQLLVVVSDAGPGIEDIELAMQPGFTTAGDEARARGFGAGMGLDNIRKYSDKLVILSDRSGVKIEMVFIAKGEVVAEEEDDLEDIAE